MDAILHLKLWKVSEVVRGERCLAVTSRASLMSSFPEGLPPYPVALILLATFNKNGES